MYMYANSGPLQRNNLSRVCPLGSRKSESWYTLLAKYLFHSCVVHVSVPKNRDYLPSDSITLAQYTHIAVTPVCVTGVTDVTHTAFFSTVPLGSKRLHSNWALVVTLHKEYLRWQNKRSTIVAEGQYSPSQVWLLPRLRVGGILPSGCSMDGSISMYSAAPRDSGYKIRNEKPTAAKSRPSELDSCHMRRQAHSTQ